MQNAGGFTRSMPPTQQSQVNMPNQTMSGVGGPQHIVTNGPVQQQMQIMPQQNIGSMQGMQSNISNMTAMQGNFRNINSSVMVIS